MTNPQKSLFAVALAASVFTLTAPRSAHAQFIAPLGTGYMGANSLQYNNPTSALLSTMIQNNMNSMMFRNMVMSQHYRRYGYGRSGPTPAQLQERRGRALIKRGRASTRFAMRPMNSVALVNEWAKRNANGRAGALEEWRGQSTIWRQAMASRGATFGDFAESQSLAFIMCIEAYTGRQLSNGAFAKDVPGTRRVYLKSPYYQGWTLAQKQNDYESMMLTASWAIYLRRHGRIEEARKTAKEFIDAHWDSNLKGVSDVQDAVSTYAKYQTGPLPMPSARLAKTPVTRAKPIPRAIARPVASVPDSEVDDAPAAPRLTLAQIVRATNYTPVAPMVLPQMFARQFPQMDEKQRGQVQRVSEKLLTMVRSDLAQNKTTPFPVNNVARAMTYALTQLYPVATAQIGQPLDNSALTPARTIAVREQFALNLASNPDFAKMSNREKQETAEMMIVISTMSGVLYNAALQDGDEAGMKDAQQLARETFGRTFGYDAAKVTFSDDKPELG